MLPQPVHRRHGHHDRQRRAAVHRTGPARISLGPAVDHRRLYPRAGQPADVVWRDRRPGRPPPGVPDRPGRCLPSAPGCAAWHPGLGWLVAFRMVQAVGGSMLNPVAMSIITNTFTDRAERARALGVWGGTFALSMALGPVLGGLLVGSVGWRGGVLGQHPGRPGCHRASREVRPRIQGADAAPSGPGRAGADHRDAGLADLRDHRGARSRLACSGDRDPVRGGSRGAGGLRSLRGAPYRTSARSAGSSAARRSRARC